MVARTQLNVTFLRTLPGLLLLKSFQYISILQNFKKNSLPIFTLGYFPVCSWWDKMMHKIIFIGKLPFKRLALWICCFKTVSPPAIVQDSIVARLEHGAWKRACGAHTTTWLSILRDWPTLQQRKSCRQRWKRRCESLKMGYRWCCQRWPTGSKSSWKFWRQKSMKKWVLFNFTNHVVNRNCLQW